MIHYNTHVAHTFYKIFEHLRYFLGGHRPSETSILTNSGSDPKPMLAAFLLPSAKDFGSRGQRANPTAVY